MKSWYEDDVFWLHFAPVLFNASKWAAAEEEMRKTVALLGLSPDNGTTILDACCGVGRHAIELARMGFEVTGVDRMSAFLEAARETAEAERAAVEFEHQDMRSFARPDTFDAAINMFTSFGYFDELQDEKKLLHNIYISLKSGGRLCIDIIGKEVVAREFKRYDWYRDEFGYMISEYRIIDNWTRLYNRWILIDEDGKFEYSFSHRIFSARELTDLVEECGFIDIEVYGSLDKTPYDHRADVLTVVGRKP
jgi:SAM-dependent methyltransferase